MHLKPLIRYIFVPANFFQSQGHFINLFWDEETNVPNDKQQKSPAQA